MGPDNGKCPGEIYGMGVAADVLPSLYASPAECAHLHGCKRDTCPLDKHWRTSSSPAGSGPLANLWGFVVTAFHGPRRNR